MDVQGGGVQTSIGCLERGRGNIFNFLCVAGGMDLFWNDPLK